LERLSEDVVGLRIAEETRLFTELNRFEHNNAQAESAPILAAIEAERQSQSNCCPEV
jgi:hypothetical protein